jgi:hypothetical protein
MNKVLCGQVLRQEDGDWCYSVLEPRAPDPFYEEVWIETDENSEYFTTKKAAREDMVAFVKDTNEVADLLKSINIKEN